MTVNGVIAILQLIGGVACGYTACDMFLQARRRWREWPVSAFIALGGIIAATAVMVIHIAWLRLWGTPFGWDWLGPNGVGTAIRTALFAGIAVALARRVKIQAILNPADRKAVKDGAA